MRDFAAVLERESFKTMLERVRSAPCGITGEACAFAPINDDGVFRSLLHEAARIALRQEAPDLLLVSDAGTLARLDTADAVLAKAARTVVLWNGADAAGAGKSGHPDRLLPLETTDRFFLFLSSGMSLAIFACEAGEGDGYSGGWTLQRSTVLRLAESAIGLEYMGAFLAAAPESPALDWVSSTLMRLSMLYADAAQVGYKDLFTGRNELLTVLEILKAIGSKRQTHDILFVFVEEVARIVATNRCSVVCIGEGDDYARVLATHEDSTVFDRRIPLEKYPELCLAAETGRKVVVNDVHGDPVTASLHRVFKEAGIDAVAVIPIESRGARTGTLLLRTARRGLGFSPREISFFEVVAEAASSALEKAYLLETVQLTNTRLEYLAVTDALTGLYNRRYFQERLEQEVERAARYRLPLSFLMLDVDNFKDVNDTLGHLTGDAVLRDISARMQACVRRVDLIARFGGEEFVIILPQTGRFGAFTYAERMCAAIGDTPVVTRSGLVSVTASIGVAVFDPEWMRTTDDLIGSADEALLKAKELGKNRVVMADNREGKP